MLLKRIFSFVLITSLLFPPLLKLGLVLDYYKNKDYIASTLCINKDKPQKKCEGKCHLNKQLAKTQEKGEEKNAPENNVKTELSPSILSDALAFFFPLKSAENYQDFLQSSYSRICSIDFFHPPRA